MKKVKKVTEEEILKEIDISDEISQYLQLKEDKKTKKKELLDLQTEYVEKAEKIQQDFENKILPKFKVLFNSLSQMKEKVPAFFGKYKVDSLFYDIAYNSDENFLTDEFKQLLEEDKDAYEDFVGAIKYTYTLNCTNEAEIKSGIASDINSVSEDLDVEGNGTIFFHFHRKDDTGDTTIKINYELQDNIIKLRDYNSISIDNDKGFDLQFFKDKEIMKVINYFIYSVSNKMSDFLNENIEKLNEIVNDIDSDISKVKEMMEELER